MRSEQLFVIDESDLLILKITNPVSMNSSRIFFEKVCKYYFKVRVSSFVFCLSSFVLVLGSCFLNNLDPYILLS